MHTMKLKSRNQFRRDVVRDHLIHLSALEQDPINLNNSQYLSSLFFQATQDGGSTPS